MKKCLSLLAFLLWSLHSIAQNSLSQKIDQDLNGLQAILKMTGMRIELRSGDSKFDPKDNSNFETPRNTEVKTAKLDTFFQNLSVGNTLLYPYSLISIDKDEYDLMKLLGQDNFYFMNNRDLEPRFTPVSFTFVDGSILKATAENYISKSLLAAKYRTTETDEDGKTYDIVAEDKMSEAEALIWNYSSFKAPILVKSPKPIKHITVDIDLPLRKLQVYEPVQQTISTSLGDITVDTIVGNQVYCTLPETEQKDAIALQAYYKDGRMLRQKGYSSTTYLSPAKRKYYENYLTLLRKAKAQVEQKSIQTEAALKTFIETELKAQPNEDVDFAKYKSAVYTFAGPVSKVDFVVSDTAIATRHFVTTAVFKHENEAYFTAQELGKDSVGLLNQQGKWVVAPRMSPYFRPWNTYYYRDQINEYDETYWFDPKSKTLVKTDYKLEDPEVYDGKYVKIEPYTNGPNGLADVTTGKMVVPMEYENLRFESNTFWVGRLNDRKGVLDRNFKPVLGFRFNQVEVDSQFIYTRTEGKRDNVYTAAGQNITNDKYTDVKGTFSNGLLLVGETRKLPNDGVNTFYYYIDPKGQVKIELDPLEFGDQRPFSAGLAAVQKKSGDWGFMNTAGKVVIPFQFKWVFYFHPTSGLAEVQLPDGSGALIDKTGKLVKKFGTEIYKRERSSEDRGGRLYGRDNTIWNEYGEVVTR
jgi:hypothetical protein